MITEKELGNGNIYNIYSSSCYYKLRFVLFCEVSFLLLFSLFIYIYKWVRNRFCLGTENS